LVKLVTSLMGF